MVDTVEVLTWHFQPGYYTPPRAISGPINRSLHCWTLLGLPPLVHQPWLLPAGASAFPQTGYYKYFNEYLPKFSPQPVYSILSFKHPRGIECYNLSFQIHSLKIGFDAPARFALSRTSILFARFICESVQSPYYVLHVHHIRCRPCGLRQCNNHHACTQLSNPDCQSSSHPCLPRSFRSYYWQSLKTCRSLKTCGFSPRSSDQTN